MLPQMIKRLPLGMSYPYKLFIFTVLFSFNSLQSQWSYGLLPKTIREPNSIFLNKDTVLIAGGFYGVTNNISNEVYYYDIREKKVVHTEYLSQPRANFSLVKGDSGIYFIGGVTLDSASTFYGAKTMDILKNNGEWARDTIPTRSYASTAVGLDGKIIWSPSMQRYNYNTKYYWYAINLGIYDEKNKTWSIKKMDRPRFFQKALTDGKIALFAGGSDGHNKATNHVDIYNSETNTWDSAKLTQPRSLIKGCYANGRFYFYGGAMSSGFSSHKIDIFDGQKWSNENMTVGRVVGGVAASGENIISLSGGTFNLYDFTNENMLGLYEVYNPEQRSLYVGLLKNYNLNGITTLNGFSSASNGEVAIFAGGYSFTSNGTMPRRYVIHYQSSLNRTTSFESGFELYPNPATETVHLKNIRINDKISVFNIHGKPQNAKRIGTSTMDISNLPSGIYFAEIVGSKHQTIKFIKR